MHPPSHLVINLTYSRCNSWYISIWVCHSLWDAMWGKVIFDLKNSLNGVKHRIGEGSQHQWPTRRLPSVWRWNWSENIFRVTYGSQNRNKYPKNGEKGVFFLILVSFLTPFVPYKCLPGPIFLRHSTISPGKGSGGEGRVPGWIFSKISHMGEGVYFVRGITLDSDTKRVKYSMSILSAVVDLLIENVD
jgi:hypothetical protein